MARLRSDRGRAASVRARCARATAALLLLAVGAAPQTSPRAAFIGGPARGIAELPEGSVAEGLMLGALYDSSGSRALYALSAKLLAYPVLCPACFAGRIDGTLDDGVGRTPDFTLRGSYAGAIGSRGSFDVTILDRSGARVGRIRGHLFDPPQNPGPGVFRGAWRLRR